MNIIWHSLNGRNIYLSFTMSQNGKKGKLNVSMEELCYFDTKIDIKIRQKTKLLT